MALRVRLKKGWNYQISSQKWLREVLVIYASIFVDVRQSSGIHVNSQQIKSRERYWKQTKTTFDKRTV